MIFDRLVGIVISMSDCHPRVPRFDSDYAINCSGNIASGTGYTQPHADN